MATRGREFREGWAQENLDQLARTRIAPRFNVASFSVAIHEVMCCLATIYSLLTVAVLQLS